MKLPLTAAPNAQVFNDRAVQGVRLIFEDGTIATFYGPEQINVPVAEKNDLELSTIEIFFSQPLPADSAFTPIFTEEEESP